MSELSLREVAEATGIHYATLCRFEQGKPIDDRNFAKLLYFLITDDKKGAKNGR